MEYPNVVEKWWKSMISKKKKRKNSYLLTLTMRLYDNHNSFRHEFH